jgi:DNA primase
VITKGLKDVMTLSSLGINAVAVRSENTPLSENAYEILQSRFNKIYLWFDADEAGRIGCKKMMDKYGIPCLFHEEKWGKDPSDIYKNYGKEKLIEICKQLEILS